MNAYPPVNQVNDTCMRLRNLASTYQDLTQIRYPFAVRERPVVPSFPSSAA
jgi:hypothetical protein